MRDLKMQIKPFQLYNLTKMLPTAKQDGPRRYYADCKARSTVRSQVRIPPVPCIGWALFLTSLFRVVVKCRGMC